MYYIIYKTTNTVNNKIYIGKHQTENLTDDYLGSGKILIQAIKKYGKEKFIKEILYKFDNEEEMNLMETKIVDEEFIIRKDTYNLALGGGGNWNSINKNVKLRKEKNRKAAIKMNKTLWANPEFRKRQALYASKRMKRLHKEGIVKAPDWTGKKHTEDSKRKIGEANSKHQKGSKNSMYGMTWIYNTEEKQSKRVPKIELDNWISKGWNKGRKMKF